MPNSFHVILGLSLGGLIFTPLAQGQTDIAQDSTLRQDAIIVKPASLVDSLGQIGQQPLTLTRQDIAASGAPFAKDILATLPSVSLASSGAFGGLSSLSVRGQSGANTLVVKDGIPLNDPTSPSGGYDFAHLNNDDIEAIALLTGPQSVLWGSDAVGGVVQITSRQPAQSALGLYFETGQFDTYRYGGNANLVKDKSYFRLSAQDYATRGISKADTAQGNTETDPYETQTLSLAGGLAVTPHMTLNLHGNIQSADTDFDGFSPTARGFIADTDESATTKEQFLSANLSIDKGGDAPAHSFTIGQSSISRTNFAGDSQTFTAKGDRVFARYMLAKPLSDTQTLGLGLAYERVKGAAYTGTPILDKETYQNAALFGVYETQFCENIAIGVGLRHTQHGDWGGINTGHIGATWTPAETLSFRASYAEGFKTPTLFQTYFTADDISANLGLQAETTQSHEVGIDWQTATARYGINGTVFDTRTQDKIVFDLAQFAYSNLSNSRAQGASASGFAALTNALKLTGNYTYTDSTEGDNKPALRIPTHSGHVALSYAPTPKISGQISLTYNGEEPTNSGEALARWTRVNLAGQYTINDDITAFVRLENALDAAYQDVLGYGTSPRAIYAGLRLNIK